MRNPPAWAPRTAPTSPSSSTPSTPTPPAPCSAIPPPKPAHSAAHSRARLRPSSLRTGPPYTGGTHTSPQARRPSGISGPVT